MERPVRLLASSPAAPLARERERSTGNTGDATASLERGLRELGLDLAPAQRHDLLELAGLLARWAERINLTAHSSPDAIVRHLVLDSLGLGALLPAFASLADLGSGAGIPGLPLAIAYPERHFTLVEARLRRSHFQQAARRELALDNVELLRGRAERLEASPHDVAVARAMAAPRRALPWMLRWVRPGGTVAIPLGPAAAALPDSDAGLGYVEGRIASGPGLLGGPPRRVWLARRAAAPAPAP